MNGYGDEVCYILNDLTTEILIKRNYEFRSPTVFPGTQSGGIMKMEADDDEDLLDEGNLLQDSSEMIEDVADNKFVEEVMVNP